MKSRPLIFFVVLLVIRYLEVSLLEPIEPLLDPLVNLVEAILNLHVQRDFTQLFLHLLSKKLFYFGVGSFFLVQISQDLKIRIKIETYGLKNAGFGTKGQRFR
jgi:hypothetical protein